MIFKAGNRELNVKYAYMATYRSGIANELWDLMQSNESSDLENINKLMGFVPKLLLVGLQRFHRDEFGYKYESEESLNDALDKIGDLLDLYFDEEESDFAQLYKDLQEELVSNGFFKSLIDKEDKQEQKTTPKSKK